MLLNSFLHEALSVWLHCTSPEPRVERRLTALWKATLSDLLHWVEENFATYFHFTTYFWYSAFYFPRGILIYNPGQKSTKWQLVTHYFEVGSHYLNYWAPLSPKQCWNSGSTLDESMSSLCWMWGGGGGQKDHYVGKSAKFPKTFDQDYSPLNTI